MSVGATSRLPGDTSACATFLRRELPADFDWEALYADAAGEAVLPSLASAAQGAELPAPVKEFLTAVEASNRERNEVIDRELRVAVELLNAAGITPVLLKGVAYQALRLYPNPGARYILDIDVLIPAAQVETAFTILSENGFRDDIPHHFHTLHHHLPPVRRPNVAHIELHSRMGRSLTNAVLAAADVIAQATPHDLDGLKVRIPCPEHLIAHLILHSQVQHRYNQRIWPPMRALYDLAFLNQKYGEAAVWEAVAARFTRAGAYELFALHLMQVEASLGMAPPITLHVGRVAKLRWLRRQFLRRHPWARFADPRYVFATLFGTRFEVVKDILATPGGPQFLMQQAFSGEHYRRMWGDLTEGCGR